MCETTEKSHSRRFIARLQLAMVLVGGLATSIMAQTDEAYAQQLKEYDRRVAEQQSQSKGFFVPALVGLLTAAGLIIWSQRDSRRRFEVVMRQSRESIAESSAQNKRIIELLESIDRKQPGGK